MMPIAYFAVGAITGFFAGLLGIGGSLVMIPLLSMLLASQGFAAGDILHLVLGTAMAAVIFTAASSIRAHHKHGAVLWPVVFKITPGILFGTLLGTGIAARIPAKPLGVFFACFVVFVAIQMLLNLKPKPTRELPGGQGIFLVGTFIGALSALVAIGGGSLTVPFLTWCNVRVQNAIGTSAAVGLPIAIGGTLGYIYNGWHQSGLPEYSLGFVYLPALIWLVLGSMLTAPLGARVTYRLPVALLKRIFACLLIILASRMVYGLFV